MFLAEGYLENHTTRQTNVLPNKGTKETSYGEEIPSYKRRPGRSESDDIEEISGGTYLMREYIWDRCPLDTKCPWFLHDKPLALLFVVIAFNWLLCFIFAQIFIEFEGPAQKVCKHFETWSNLIPNTFLDK